MRTTAFIIILAMTLCFTLADFHVPASASGYGQIKGVVTDVKTGTFISFANIVIVGTQLGAMTAEDGRFVIGMVPAGTYTLKALMMGYKTVEVRNVVVKGGEATEIEFALEQTIVSTTQEILVTGPRKAVDMTSNDVRSGNTQSQVDQIGLRTGRVKSDQFGLYARGGRPSPSSTVWHNDARGCYPRNTEDYDFITENGFLDALDDPLSTFSIDVDAASYSNARRFIMRGQLPPRDAVRVEELINYFNYDYPDPEGPNPFSIYAEVAACPWTPANQLVHIGLQGERIATEDLPPNNLVFLIDVSGSMRPANKLPLLKSAFRLLIANMRHEDRVAIVVYAGAAGIVLPPTRGSDKQTLLDALDRLQAGGSTAGAAGIQLAYQTAEMNFIDDGNNRVILATDGDFNVGVSSDAQLVEIIEEKRRSGIFLTVLGFGEGNLKDAKMDKIADKGNGHYAYIDNLREAHKVLVKELGATLLTIAKDVKIQIEFNPVKVKSYRLIGYENRLLAREEFDNDEKDAGELGAGHSVTALYEIVPADRDQRVKLDDGLQYVAVGIEPEAYETDDVLTIRFRYKSPDSDKSRLISGTVTDRGVGFDEASDDLVFSAAVAEFGMLLRNSEFKGYSSYGHILESAKSAVGKDTGGYRAEFIRLVEACAMMSDE